jgi:hypothetical protein
VGNEVVLQFSRIPLIRDVDERGTRRLIWHNDFYLDFMICTGGDLQLKGSSVMNSSSHLSLLSDSRLQPLYPFMPLSGDNPELLRVKPPANNAETAVEKAHSLYLHMTGDGRALLYVETEGRGTEQ